jgi:translation initiation factor 1
MEILRLSIAKKDRGGKVVTLISGFTRRAEELEDLSSHIKKACGTGGTVRGQVLEIQGDARIRLREILQKEGFGVRG